MTISDFVFQVAVPKTLQLSLEPPSGTNLSPPGVIVTQKIVVTNSSKAVLKFKFKVNYKVNGGAVEKIHELYEFPKDFSFA